VILFSIVACNTNLTSAICSPVWTFCKQSEAVTLKVGTVNCGHLRNENCDKGYFIKKYHLDSN